MDIITSFIQQAFDFIIPLIVLLGALIFIHELGHFLVAKYCGVKVETFSLGFGKKILKYKHGDTTYCISLIPLGGYVKMFGDDPNAEVSEEDKKHSFLHKPVGQRIAIVLAGPLMNLFFAFFLFIFIAVLGDKKPLPILGQLPANSTAESLGLSDGDRVTKVNNATVATWSEMTEAFNNSDLNVNLHYKKYGSDIEQQTIIELVKEKNPNPLSIDSKIQTIEGLEMTPIASRIGVINNSLAEDIGFLSGDQIIAVNDEKIERWYELVYSVNSLNIGQEATFKIKRWNKDKSKTKNLNMVINDNNLPALGIERPDLYIGIIGKDSPAEKADLAAGDKIISVNGENVFYWTDLTEKIVSFKEEDEFLKLGVLRNNETLDIELRPTKMIHTNPMTGKSEKQFKIGIGPVLVMTAPATDVFYPTSMVNAVSIGAAETWHWTVATAMGFVRLVQNEVSAKSIGGPIMIGQIASESYKMGINAFLKIMAIISINLFILNLLPIPVLDGGHLVFFTIEAIKGSPLSMSKLEKAQQVGLFLLLFLMVFALFNDITRAFGIQW